MMLPDSKQIWLYIIPTWQLHVKSSTSVCNIPEISMFGTKLKPCSHFWPNLSRWYDGRYFGFGAVRCFASRKLLPSQSTDGSSFMIADTHTHPFDMNTPPHFFMKQVKTNSVFISMWIFQPCWHNDSNSGKNKKANLLHLAGDVNPRRQHAV